MANSTASSMMDVEKAAAAVSAKTDRFDAAALPPLPLPPRRSHSDPETPGSPTPNPTYAGSALSRVPTALQPSLGFSRRLLHFTFAWFTVTMSTSGISLLLALTPYRFPGLSYIGLVVFLIDLAVFLATCLILLMRFTLYPKTFVRASTHPREALFVACFFLSVAAILANVQAYADLFLAADEAALARLEQFMIVTFWVYTTVTFLYGIVQYHLLFTVKEDRRLSVAGMTPAWVFPVFPVMLSGMLAASIATAPGRHVPPSVVLAGLAAQGLGMLISIFMFATYLSRLMAFGLPAQRPGMFIAVGPPSFTCAAILGLAEAAPRVVRALVADSSSSWVAADLSEPLSEEGIDALVAGIRLLALLAATFLWGLSFWYCASGIAGMVARDVPDRKFHLSWWSLVFPNVGFTSSCIKMGRALESDGLLWLSSGMTIVLVTVWLLVGVLCVRAVLRRQIVWPGHDEDS